MNSVKPNETRAGGDQTEGGAVDPVEVEQVAVNPLLNNVVIETLFAMLPFDDMKSARLVNKIWWKSSLPQWRKKCVIKIRGDRRDAKGRIVKIPSSTQVSFQQFLDILARWTGPGDPFQFETLPFENYDVCLVNLDLSQKGLERSIQSEFWNTFGPKMKHLKIRKSTFNNFQTFKTILFEATPKLEALHLEVNDYEKYYPKFRSLSLSPSRPLQFKPKFQRNLKELGIVLREFDSEAIHRRGSCSPVELPMTWGHMLSYFPSLQTVVLKNIDSNDYCCPSLVAFLETVINLRSEYNPKSVNLNAFNIMDVKTNALLALPPPVIFYLQALRWPLSSLTLDIGVHTDSNIFREILQIHADTLKKLTVFRAPYGHAFQNFPFGVRLNYLEELQVIGPIFHDLLFVEFMPHLKRLIIVDGSSAIPLEFAIEPADRALMECKPPESVIMHTDFSLISNVVLHHLVEFSGDAGQICPVEKVTELARLMPNLKKLKLKIVGGEDGFNLGDMDVRQLWIGLGKDGEGLDQF